MHEQHSNQLEIIDAQLEGVWAHLVPPPPSPPYAPREAHPRPPYRYLPYLWWPKGGEDVLD